MATASTSNANANMVSGKEFASELTASFVESRRKHQIAVVSILVHIFTS